MPDSPATRASLLVRLRDPRDGPAWARFVEVYAPLVYGYARKQGLQDADAADLTQEVLRVVSQAVRRLEYDPARGSFRGWLFTLVRNDLRTFWDRQRRQVRGSGDSSAQARLAEEPAPDDGAGELWEAEYRRRLFSWAVRQVEPTVEASSWRAFWLTSIDGRPARGVAEELGLTVAAVYMAKSRIKARLRELVQEADEGELPLGDCDE
jgi:RNA polymerase sigma-70 factor (ECF subfamily)